MTQSERNRKLREQRERDGLSELRSVFVPTDLHAEAKRVIAEWLERVKPKT